jgi:Flp pilus assembly pilin Flp
MNWNACFKSSDPKPKKPPPAEPGMALQRRIKTMKTLNNTISRFVSEEAGLETVEYAVIAALITGAAIVAITSLGTKVAAKFNTLVTQLT